jgi:hypothetical protein
MPWCNSPQAWCHAGAGRSFRMSLTGQVRGWVTHLCSQRSPATVRKIHRVLSLVLALAVRDGQLTRNLAPEVNLPRVGLTRARLPTAWFALAAPMVGGAVTPGFAYRSCDALAPACGSAGYSMSESGPLAGSVSSVSALRSAAASLISACMPSATCRAYPLSVTCWTRAACGSMRAAAALAS